MHIYLADTAELCERADLRRQKNAISGSFEGKVDS